MCIPRFFSVLVWGISRLGFYLHRNWESFSQDSQWAFKSLALLYYSVLSLYLIGMPALFITKKLAKIFDPNAVEYLALTLAVDGLWVSVGFFVFYKIYFHFFGNSFAGFLMTTRKERKNKKEREISLKMFKNYLTLLIKKKYFLPNGIKYFFAHKPDAQKIFPSVFIQKVRFLQKDFETLKEDLIQVKEKLFLGKNLTNIFPKDLPEILEKMGSLKKRTSPLLEEEDLILEGMEDLKENPLFQEIENLLKTGSEAMIKDLSDEIEKIKESIQELKAIKEMEMEKTREDAHREKEIKIAKVFEESPAKEIFVHCKERLKILSGEELRAGQNLPLSLELLSVLKNILKNNTGQKAEVLAEIYGPINNMSKYRALIRQGFLERKAIEEDDLIPPEEKEFALKKMEFAIEIELENLRHKMEDDEDESGVCDIGAGRPLTPPLDNDSKLEKLNHFGRTQNVT